MASLAEKAFGTYLRLHDTVYQRTNGWIGHRMMLLPSLLCIPSAPRPARPARRR